MDTRTGALIIISVLISAVAQVSLKFGMSSSRVATALSDDSHWNTTLTIATTPAVITGLALYVSGRHALALGLGAGRREPGLSVCWPRFSRDDGFGHSGAW